MRMTNKCLGKNILDSGTEDLVLCSMKYTDKDYRELVAHSPPHPKDRSRPIRTTNRMPFSIMIVCFVFGIGAFLLSFYGLVRFIKWAWYQ